MKIFITHAEKEIICCCCLMDFEETEEGFLLNVDEIQARKISLYIFDSDFGGRPKSQIWTDTKYELLYKLRRVMIR